MKRWFTVTAWLLAGHAILGGLYWLLLQVPESNALMLAASVLVIVGALGWLGCVECVGVRAFGTTGNARVTLASGLRRSGWIVPALVVFVAVWLLAGFTANWWTSHRGEVDAWLILRFGWTDGQPLHTTVAWLLWFVRYGVGLSLAVALLAAAVCRGAAGVLSVAWLARAFNWKALLITTTALWVGIWLPWHYVEWRPASLPHTWAQPAFAATKLFLFAVVMNGAWAVVLWWAGRGAAAVATLAATPSTAALSANTLTEVPAPPVPESSPSGTTGDAAHTGSPVVNPSSR